MPSIRSMMRATAESQAHEAAAAATLREKGWRLTPKGWTHPHLAFPWPMADAARIQGEADDGRQDAVCMSLRGDCWPA